LLADGHISGTDPVRLAVSSLPSFVLAYNWTRVVHFVLCGLGMLVLLISFRFPLWLCLALAFTYESASCFALWFSYPWLQASFLYYPFLWLVWSKASAERPWLWIAVASLPVAFAVCAGNLQ